MNKLFLCLIILLSINQLNASVARFQRLIRLYNNYEYLHKNRGILFKYERAKYFDDTSIVAIDTGIYDDNNNSFLLYYNFEEHSGNLLKDKSKIISAAYNTYIVSRTNKANPTSTLDTLNQHFEINGKYDYHLSKYFTKNPEKKTPFVQLVSSVNGNMFYAKKRGFDRDLESIEDDSQKWDWINKRKYNATVLADVSPGICIGRQIFVTPVYHALKLEKKLLDDSIVSSQLSDKTILSIAKLLSKKKKYNSKNIEIVKEFKEELDSIIVKDSAIERKNLRYISPMDINSIVFCKRNVFMAKPRLRLFSTSRLRTCFEKNDITHPYYIDTLSNNNPMYTDTSFTDNTIKYEHLLGIDLEWGMPLTNFSFLNIRAYRHLLSTEHEIKFFDHKDRLILDEVLDVRWDLLASIIVAHSFVIQTGVDNLPAWLVAPSEHPYKYFMNFNIYIEDYLSLIFATSYYHSGERYKSYYNWSAPFIRSNRGFALSMKVTYNFRK